MQSFNTEHPSIARAAVHDYEGFAASELATRKLHNYPPYQRMARLIIRSKEEKVAADFAELLAGSFRVALTQLQEPATPPSPSDGRGAPARNTGDLRLLGPAEAPIFRLKNYYRFHFQLQSPSSAALHQVLRSVIPTVRPPHGVDLTVDIDPQDMV